MTSSNPDTTADNGQYSSMKLDGNDNPVLSNFSGSELRGLFPENLPIFYMYSIRRGVGSKPWFLPSSVTDCITAPCQCAAFRH